MFNLQNSKFYTFYITLLLILTSATAIIGKQYYITGLIILFASSILLFKTNFSRSGLLWGLIISFTLLINYLITPNNDYSNYVTATIKISSVLLIFNALNLKLMAKYFVYIMATISLISIFFYLFGYLNPNVIRSNIPLTDVWGGKFRVTPFYVYQNYWVNRNNSIWTEPGAFQIYVNAALFISLKLNLKPKHKKLIQLIFFITIISTLSTTAYVIYGLIILSQYWQLIKKVNPSKLLIICFILLSIFTVEEMTYGAIVNKFNAQDISYKSFERRVFDIEMGIEQISQKPLTGWGLGNIEKYKSYEYTDSSNGLLQLGADFGIIFLSFYLCATLYMFRKFTRNKFETLLIFLSFIIISNSQDIIWLPLSIGIFFIPGLFKISHFKEIENNKVKVY
ncbi:O-antigen ligase family protein [Paraliobacillus ryukyuensis]|uniref:O-antigen ligase family protein n=1 Tax=Paraliobacillus ryukyuensis TaxID=200904 RepID=UPI0009A8859E|nr:O-antigen ligase family protein [Paraliobacillus ryukyuensis]